jgi:hypothetical protein
MHLWCRSGAIRTREKRHARSLKVIDQLAGLLRQRGHHAHRNSFRWHRSLPWIAKGATLNRPAEAQQDSASNAFNKLTRTFAAHRMARETMVAIE